MLNYSKAGVDVKKVRKLQGNIGKMILNTHLRFEDKNWKVLSGFGHYAGLIEFESKIIALHTDGVGTKTIVAQLMNRFDTLGIDCVAMNVNDIICVGAVPVGFLDYIALRKPDNYLVKELLKGLTKGAEESEMAIVGGETAILPDLLNQKEENSFDLVGSVFGVTDKKKLVLGDKITEGDIIFGIESNGLHSNGYSLARKVILPKYKLKDRHIFLDSSIGEELLKPTKIYVKPIHDILDTERESVSGLAHITGGSFSKLSRLNSRVNYDLNNLPTQNGIFKLIQKEGKISHKEMYSTFNMGVGFCIIASKSRLDRIKNILDKHKLKHFEIGFITKGTGKVFITTLGRKYALTD